jgi:large subunit ribosomal protein L5
MTNLKAKYQELIKDYMMKKYKYSSVMQVPKLEKIVINSGVGDATKDAKLVESAKNEIEAITGQKAIFTVSKKSIATFRLRENQNIGVKVTLRGERM